MNPTSMGAPADTKAALQALGKRIIENSTLYHFPKSTDGLASPGGTVQLPPKKQKLDINNNNNNTNNKGNDNRTKEQEQRDPYLTYEQYENLLYRGKPQQVLHTKDHLVDGTTTTTTTTTGHGHGMMNDNIPVDSLISELHYDVNSPIPLTSSLSSPLSNSLTSALSSSLSSSLPSTIDTSSLSPSVTANLSLSSSLAHHNLSSLLPPSQMALIAPHSPHSPLSHPHQPLPHPHVHSQQPLPQPHSPVSAHSLGLASPTNTNNNNQIPGTAHAVAMLASAENQKIQRKKANQQEREVLEKYYNEHYVDQSVKIRKEDLTELAYTLNWHVLRVQGWMHTHRQSRSDYNPPKRTKRRATLPQEQDILKHYFKIWTEQGLIDLHTPTRVTPKDYEVVATALGWDNERVRRWTDHYKQKIKAASEGSA